LRPRLNLRDGGGFVRPCEQIVDHAVRASS
jgi:hypothetical protein